jgi:hypothetical protein
MSDIKRIQKTIDDRKSELAEWKARAARAEQETAENKKVRS